jgi:hypothetical protein
MILSVCELNYKRSAHMKLISFDIAPQVLQQCKSEHGIHAGLPHHAARFYTWIGEKYEMRSPRAVATPSAPTVSIDGQDAI